MAPVLAPLAQEPAPTEMHLPVLFATPLAQLELVSSQQRGASPSATRSTTPRSDLAPLTSDFVATWLQANTPSLVHSASSWSQQTPLQVEDRPIVKEQITYVREHHPMEKEFIVETRPTGRERELTEGRTSEVSLYCDTLFKSGRHQHWAHQHQLAYTCSAGTF